MAGERLDILTVSEGKPDENGEVQKYWNRAGVAFPNKLGGYNLVINPGTALFGDNIVMVPPRDRDEDAPKARTSRGRSRSKSS